MEFYTVDSVFKRLQDVGEHPDRRRSMTLTSAGGCGRSRGSRSSSSAEKASISVIDALAGVTYSASR
jgi:hypothetical protein